MLDKKSVVAAIKAQLSRDLELATAAAEDARQTATNKENVAENKYDTLGLEAAYLAHGHSSRVLRLQEELHRFEALDTMSQDDEVCLGSLVAVTRDGSTVWYFVGPGAPGLTLNIRREALTVVTPESPLGEALLGLGINDMVAFGDAALEIVELK